MNSFSPKESLDQSTNDNGIFCDTVELGTPLVSAPKIKSKIERPDSGKMRKEILILRLRLTRKIRESLKR